MEQLCNICGSDEKENVKGPKSTVFFICENCMKSELLPPLLDQIFLE